MGAEGNEDKTYWEEETMTKKLLTEAREVSGRREP
jgi:hypothetical protein